MNSQTSKNKLKKKERCEQIHFIHFHLPQDLQQQHSTSARRPGTQDPSSWSKLCVECHWMHPAVAAPWKFRFQWLTDEIDGGFFHLPGLVNCHITNWKITIFNEEIDYFDWAIFNSYVKLPEGNGSITKAESSTGIQHPRRADLGYPAKQFCMSWPGKVGPNGFVWK